MYYNSIYSQLFNFIPRYRFEKIVNKSGGDRYCKHFTAWKQFMTLLFAQIEFLGHHRKPNKKLGVLCDEIIWYTGFQSVKKYPGELRVIEFRDEESGKTYLFIRTAVFSEPLGRIFRRGYDGVAVMFISEEKS